MPAPSVKVRHQHVDAGGRDDLAEVDREAVGEQQRVAVRQPGGDVVGEQPPLQLVRREDHDQVASGGGLARREHLEALLARRLHRRRARAQPHHDAHPRVAQVQRVGVALAAVADHGHGLAAQQVEVGVCVVVHRHGGAPGLVWRGGGGRVTVR
jgi:uncharacterized phage protein gp47/JayE